MPEPPVIDTVVLRVMTFAHPPGVEILLRALTVPAGRFPAEVYNRDEGDLPEDVDDTALSELARGLRYARRRSRTLPAPQAERYRGWLENARQLSFHFERGSLYVDPLSTDDLPQREALMAQYGIDLGEAACLMLASRSRAPALFLSADELACRAAQTQKIPYLTLLNVIERWVEQDKPDDDTLTALLTGMGRAKYGLRQDFVERLKALRR